jgi:hypothetical protein
MISISDLNRTIMLGDFTNDQLDSIINAVKFRRNQIAKQNKQTLKPGSSVKFYSSKQARLVIGTVTKVNRKYVIVREQTSGQFAISNWRVPANMLETA